jgi:hypothetical protein
VKTEVEAAVQYGARYGRAIVLLSRAAWLLEQAEKELADAPEVECIHTTIEILTGACRQATLDLAMGNDENTNERR